MNTINTAAKILAAIRARAKKAALWMDFTWQSGQASPDQGQAISPAEVARLLTPPDISQTAEQQFFAEHASEIPTLAATAAAELAADPGWRGLTRIFSLAPEEADFLALLVAVELDPNLSRVTAYLHDDTRRSRPTPYLSACLAGAKPKPFLGANLTAWLLASPIEGDPGRQTTPWQADPAFCAGLATGHWADPVLDRISISFPRKKIQTLLLLHPVALATLSALRDPCTAELVAGPGLGKRILAAQYAANQKRDLLAIDATDASVEILTRSLRQAALTNSLVYFANADAVAEPVCRRAQRLKTAFLRGVRHPTGHATPIQLNPLPISGRRDLWRHLSATEMPARLVAQRLSPGEICSLVTGSAPARRKTPDHALLTCLPTPYGWDDLVLPSDILAELRALESQIRLRWAVYEDWGFSRLTHLGQGISALFGGLSGTGKTMAAQVLAASLNLDLLRVDLAGVVNKYIGETEKKLREVFDACEDSGALLFFDEADALFGQRTQVKDAHDRFANIEIDYLLQRIERFDGVAILATNRRQDLDPAFIRRLRFMIEFMPPGPMEREALWRRALLPQAPRGEIICAGIDYEYLAKNLTITGAEIKNIALAAAFLARAESSKIAMRHIFLAAERELAKQGERLRIPLREAAE